MTSVYQDIRGVLAAAVNAVAGVPPDAQRAYEGLLFTPTVGTPYMRQTLLGLNGRPFDIAAETTAHKGLYQVDLFYPSGKGTGPIEALADTIKLAFPASTILAKNGETISISYSERGQVVVDSDDPAWLHLPVTIGWSCYSARN